MKWTTRVELYPYNRGVLRRALLEFVGSSLVNETSDWILDFEEIMRSSAQRKVATFDVGYLTFLNTPITYADILELYIWLCLLFWCLLACASNINVFLQICNMHQSVEEGKNYAFQDKREGLPSCMRASVPQFLQLHHANHNTTKPQSTSRQPARPLLHPQSQLTVCPVLRDHEN